MKLVELEGYVINPESISYMSTTTVDPPIAGESPSKVNHETVLRFIGGGELKLSGISALQIKTHIEAASRGAREI